MPALFDRYRELRRILPPAYWTVWLGTLINRAGGFAVPLLMFYLIDERGLDRGDAGAIVSLYGAGGVGAALLGGVMADRVGRKATMVTSLLGGAAAMGALGVVREPAAIAVVTLILGFVAELYRPAVQAFVADVVPPEHRLRAYGLLHWVINIGFSIAPVAAGLVAGWSYTALFVVDAITMAVFGLIVLLRVPETRPAHAPDPARPPIGLVHVLADRAFMAFWLLTFLFALIIFQHNATLSSWFADQGHGPRTFGAVLALNGVLIVLFQPFLIERVRAGDPGRLLGVAALVTGAGFALHGASALVAVHVAAVALWTLGEIISSPTSGAVVAELAPAEARGRYQGVFTMAWGLASFAGPFFGPRLLEGVGPAPFWAGCLALGALLALAYPRILTSSRKKRSISSSLL